MGGTDCKQLHRGASRGSGSGKGRAAPAPQRDSTMAFKGEDELPKAIILDLADDVFLLKAADEEAPEADKAAAAERITKCIAANGMTDYHKHIAGVLGRDFCDASPCDAMATKNEEELKAIDAKIEDAKENLGATEVCDALTEKAEFFGRIGDKESALSTYDECMEKTTSLGPKLDIVLAEMRLALFWNDLLLMKKLSEKAQDMLKTGGDWERRNRLKVYEGL